MTHMVTQPMKQKQHWKVKNSSTSHHDEQNSIVHQNQNNPSKLHTQPLPHSSELNKSQTNNIHNPVNMHSDNSSPPSTANPETTTSQRISDHSLHYQSEASEPHSTFNPFDILIFEPNGHITIEEEKSILHYSYDHISFNHQPNPLSNYVFMDNTQNSHVNLHINNPFSSHPYSHSNIQSSSHTSLNPLLINH